MHGSHPATLRSRHFCLEVLEGLRRELGLGGGDLFARGRVERERVAELLLASLARPSADVRAASVRLWAASYGRPLPPLVADASP